MQIQSCHIKHGVRHTRPAFAMLAVLVAIVVMATLCAITTFTVAQLSGAVRTFTLYQQAQQLAEHQIGEAIAWLDPVTFATYPSGYATSSVSQPSEHAKVVTTITKTQPNMLWIVSVATAIRGSYQAQYQIGMSATLTATPVPAIVPLSTRSWIPLF